MSDSVTPWTAARQASVSFTISRGLLKFVSTESGMPSYHLTSVAPLLGRPPFCPGASSFSLCLPVLPFSLGPLPWSASLLWDFFPFLSNVLCLASGSLGGGLLRLGLGGYVTHLSCPRQTCAPHVTCRQPWVMQPVFLKEEEGSDPRRPFDSVKPGSACFCCRPRPVPAPVVGTLEPSRGGGK